MELPGDRLVRMSCEWLARHNRVVMEVTINRSQLHLQQQAQAAATAAQTPTGSVNASMRSMDSSGNDLAAVRAIMAASQQGTQRTDIKSPVRASNESPVREGYCTRCRLRRVNSLCTNASCKSCCFSLGHWACNVHKKSGPRKEELSHSSPQASDLVGYPTPSTPSTPNTPTLPSVPASTHSQGSAAATTPSMVSMKARSAYLQQSAAQFQVPCPFCSRQVSTRRSHFGVHVQSCRPAFYEKYPKATTLPMAHLFRACWSVARPGQPVPPFITPHSAQTAGSATAISTNAAATAKATGSAVPPSPSLPAGLPRAVPVRGPEGIGPSYTEADLARAVAWEKGAGKLPEHIQEMLPLPVMRKAPVRSDKRISEAEFGKLCNVARVRDKHRQADVDYARCRFKSTTKLFSQLFAPATEEEPKEGERDQAVRRRRLIFWKEWLWRRRASEIRATIQQRNASEGCRARSQLFSEQTMTLIRRLQEVRSAAELKAVAAAFTQQHGAGWRARMPSNVQARRKLPLRGSQTPTLAVLQ